MRITGCTVHYAKVYIVYSVLYKLKIKRTRRWSGTAVVDGEVEEVEEERSKKKKKKRKKKERKELRE